MLSKIFTEQQIKYCQEHNLPLSPTVYKHFNYNWNTYITYVSLKGFSSYDYETSDLFDKHMKDFYNSSIYQALHQVQFVNGEIIDTRSLEDQKLNFYQLADKIEREKQCRMI